MDEGIFNPDFPQPSKPAVEGGIYIREITPEEIEDVEFSEGEGGVDGFTIVIEDPQTRESKVEFIPREMWKYKGSDITNYSGRYAEQKRDYLDIFHIKTEDLKPQEIITAALMLYYLTGVLEAKLDGKNWRIALGCVNRLLPSRIDRNLATEDMGEEVCFAHYRPASNARSLVHVDRYHMLLDRVLQAFPRKKPQEMV